MFEGWADLVLVLWSIQHSTVQRSTFSAPKCETLYVLSPKNLQWRSAKKSRDPIACPDLEDSRNPGGGSKKAGEGGRASGREHAPGSSNLAVKWILAE